MNLINIGKRLKKQPDFEINLTSDSIANFKSNHFNLSYNIKYTKISFRTREKNLAEAVKVSSKLPYFNANNAVMTLVKLAGFNFSCIFFAYITKVYFPGHFGFIIIDFSATKPVFSTSYPFILVTNLVKASFVFLIIASTLIVSPTKYVSLLFNKI